MASVWRDGFWRDSATGDIIAVDPGVVQVGDTLWVKPEDATIIAGTVFVRNWPAAQMVSGPLTDAELRTSAVPVSGTFWPPTQPVSISQQIKAREDAAIMTWVSAKTAAPAANAVQADTGALAAGNHDFDIQVFVSDTVAVGKGLIVEHRNAANGATLQNLGGVPAGGADQIRLRNYAIAANERIRVIAGTAAGAASSMYVSAIGRRLA